jgi:microcystin-dependent protein
VDHNQTTGGTGGTPHDHADPGDVSSIQSSSDVDHNNTSGGTSGNPHSASASTNHGNGAHSETFAVDGDSQPPETHGNGAHSETFAVDGDSQPPESHDNAAHSTNFLPQSELPTGIITMWSGGASNVPSGWTLCDGSNGAPDLRDRFVVGAGSSYTTGDTGGADEVQLTESELPSHSHGTNAELVNTGADGDQGYRDSGRDAQTASIDPAGGDEAHENRPPYYALAYIYKL